MTLESTVIVGAVQFPDIVQGNVLCALMAYALNLVAAFLSLVLHNGSLNLCRLIELDGQTVGALVKLVNSLDVLPSVVGHRTVGCGECRTDNTHTTASLRSWRAAALQSSLK